MNRFKDGKIYRLTNGYLDYYGSTCLTLEERFQSHKYHYLNYKRTGNINSTSYLLFDENKDPSIDLIRNYPCESKEQLESMEMFYILSNDCVNTKVNH